MKRFVLFLSLVIIFGGCSTTKKNIQKEYIHDTVRHTEYITNLKYDSIYLHDSIFSYMRGDTVFIYKDKYLYKYKYLHDTMSVCDTIFLTNVQTKEVTKEKTKHSVLDWIVFILSLIGIISLCYILTNKKQIKL